MPQNKKNKKSTGVVIMQNRGRPRSRSRSRSKGRSRSNSVTFGNTSRTDGRARRPHLEFGSEATRKAYASGSLSSHKAFLSHHELWEGSILEHLFDRRRFYGLPSINLNVGVNGGQNAFGPTAGDGIDPSTNSNNYAGWLPPELSNGFTRSIATGKYGIFSGKVNSSADITVAGNGSLHVLICFRPDMVGVPVLVIPNYPFWDTTPVLANTIGIDWTEAPFIETGLLLAGGNYTSVPDQPTRNRKTQLAQKILQRMRDAQNDGSEIKELDSLGAAPVKVNAFFGGKQAFVYPGGYEMTIEHVNKTAYTSTAFRQRTSSNTVHDFIDLWDTVGLGAQSIDMGVLDPFVNTKSIHTCFSGDRWKAPIAYDGNYGPPLDDYQILCSVMQCISNDYPVVQCVVTNTGPDVAAISLNIVINGWQGVAPLILNKAGAMPYETVPFTIPPWIEFARLTGVTGKPNNTEQSLSTLSQPILNAMVAGTTMVPKTAAAIVSRNPRSMAVSVRAPNTPSKPGFAKRVLNTVGNIASEGASALGNLAVTKLGEKLLHSVENAGKRFITGPSGKFQSPSFPGAFIEELPEEMEAVESALPLLLTMA